MATKMKIRRDDEVIVTAGKDKGVKGIITKVFPKENRVIVSGVNVVRKHIRPSASSPEGGIKDMEKSIHASNVQIFDAKTDKPSRVGFKLVEGKKIRFAKASGESLEK